ncbi:MAG TPA: hypothetical protein VJB61_22820, partial [Actinomycetota bacterium]
MLAVAQVTLHDGLEGRLVQGAAQQAVQQGRKAQDRRRGQDPTRAQHPPRLGQRPDPVGPVGQVVQGTQQQGGVGAGVGPVQLPGVTDGGAGQRGGRLFG